MAEWESMSVDEYAALEQRQGAKLCQVNGIWWRRVRPFFYRPMLTYQAYEAATLTHPCRWPGGCQYAVKDAHKANSTLSFLILENLQDYRLDQLGHNRRRLIKNATKGFQVRQITDVAGLQAQGYPAYLSFYERTGYGYKKDRTRKSGFDQWAATVLGNPKAIVLGGYGEDSLKAVSVSYWVGKTLLYATFFSDSAALRKNLGDLMFHELRRRVAQQAGIKQVLVRSYQGGSHHDQYYLIRGCKLVSMPAILHVNAGVMLALRIFAPLHYARLRGQWTETPSPAPKSGGPAPPPEVVSERMP
jgi:hypothetical protein